MWDAGSQPGIEPVLPAMEAWSLHHWTAKEVLLSSRFPLCFIPNNIRFIHLIS